MVTNDIKMLNSDRENNDLLLKTQNGRIWNFRPWIYTPPPPPPTKRNSSVENQDQTTGMVGVWVTGMPHHQQFLVW